MASARWESERMRFDARHDGVLVNCAVLRLALVDFAEVADTPANARAAFEGHADLVEAAARGKIEREEFDSPSEIIIRLADLEAVHG